VDRGVQCLTAALLIRRSRTPRAMATREHSGAAAGHDSFATHAITPPRLVRPPHSSKWPDAAGSKRRRHDRTGAGQFQGAGVTRFRACPTGAAGSFGTAPIHAPTIGLPRASPWGDRTAYRWLEDCCTNWAVIDAVIAVRANPVWELVPVGMKLGHAPVSGVLRDSRQPLAEPSTSGTRLD
jgi:hypothetical protein